MFISPQLIGPCVPVQRMQ